MGAQVTDRDGFLAAICERPSDDLPRLIFADYLDERGEAERAELIRLQCQHGCDTGLEYAGLIVHHEPGIQEIAERVFILVEVFGEQWFVLTALDSPYYLRQFPYASYAPVWRRGFVEEITTTFENWRRISADVIRRTPLKKVRLTTMPEPFPSQNNEAWTTERVRSFSAWPGIQFELADSADNVRVRHLLTQVEMTALLRESLSGDNGDNPELTISHFVHVADSRSHLLCNCRATRLLDNSSISQDGQPRMLPMPVQIAVQRYRVPTDGGFFETPVYHCLECATMYHGNSEEYGVSPLREAYPAWRRAADLEQAIARR